jgi:hypothetical protein
MIQKEKGPGLMRKIFILSLLAMMIAWGISGCGGGGEGTSADPLGMDGLTLESAATQVNPGDTILLTATVKNASGAAVVGRDVSFGFASNASGATLTVSSAKTNSAGQTTTLYRAGGTWGFDVIRASLSNGSRMEVNITVGSPTGGRQIALSASPTSLAAGQHSILTATVTDINGHIISGEIVAFSFVGGAAPSGATLTALNYGVTDAKGQAWAVYTAGAAKSTQNVEDTIQATAENASAAVILTRTAVPEVPEIPVEKILITIEEVTPTEVNAGAMSVIIAQVKNSDNKLVSGKSVTFAFVTNNSGATLTVVNGTTDADGKAIALYTAGSNSPDLSILDAVSASVIGSADVQIITRLAAPATPETPEMRNVISLTLNNSSGTPPIVTLPTTSSNCIVTATVTLKNMENNKETPVANETVVFSIVTGRGGFQPDPSTTTTVIAATDNSGHANAVFTAPGGNSSGETVVRAQIFGTVNGGDAVGIVRYAPPATP